MKKKLIGLLALILVLVSVSGCMSEYYGEVSPEAEKVLTAELLSRFEPIAAVKTEEEALDLYEEYGTDGDALMASAMEAWAPLIQDLGEQTGDPEATVVRTKEGYSTNLAVPFEKRVLNVTMETTGTKVQEGKTLNINSIALEGVYTTGEKVTKAALNTVMGMGTVFVVLIIIIFFISGLSVVNRIGKKKEEKPAAAPVKAAEPEPEANPADDLALIAVITAAIAAQENVSPDGLVVRSIKRRSAWKRA